MARLPDNAPSGSSLWDGVQDSWFDDGAGRPAAASIWNTGTTPFDEQQQHAIDALRQAEADAAYLTRVEETRRAAAAAGNVDELKTIESDWQTANVTRASAFADARLGAQWAAEREIETGEAIATRRAEVAGQQRVDNVNAWLDGLQTSALRAGGDEAVQLIDTGTRLIHGLTGAGHIDQATAQAMQRHWVQNYAKAWVEMRPVKERLALLGDAPTQSEVGADSGSAERSTATEVKHLIGTVADFLPSEDRERIRREAQVELDRNTTQQTLQKADQYQQSMTQASRGEPIPPPWRAAIQADPDLDELTRARLLKQHDAMQQKLDAFWLAKAEYDKPNGRKFDVRDARDRDFVEQIYTRLGGDTAALYAVVSRIGLMPDAAFDAMNGRLNSKDFAKTAQALSDLGRLTGTFRLLLALSGERADDLQNDLSEFRYYLQSGTEEQAVKRFIDARSSASRTATSRDLTGAHVDAVIVRATPISHFYRVFGDNPAVTRAVISAYRNVVKDRYAVTGDLNLAKAQADGHMKPLLDAAAEDATRKGAADRPSWIERAWLNGLDGYYRGTVRGAANLRELHDIVRKVEATPPEAMEKLLYELYPGLKQVGWNERTQYEMQLLKSAPERLKKIQADLKRYNEMKDSDTVSEFGAAAAGQIVASLLSPESYAGWSVKGASWVVRALKAAIQQGGIAGVADLETQRNLVEAGEQSNYDWRRALSVVAGSAAFGPANVHGKPKGEHVGVTPEGAPKQQAPEVKLDESTPSAPRSQGSEVVPAEVPSSPVPNGDKPAPASEAQAVALRETPASLPIHDQVELGAGELTKQPTSVPNRSPPQNQALTTGSEEIQPGVSSESGPSRQQASRLEGQGVADHRIRMLWTEEAKAPLAQRVAKIEELAPKHPVSEKYIKAEVGEVGSKNYPESFFAANGDNLRGKVEVHRAVERWIHDWYPGLFTTDQINSLANLRGIPMDGIGSALHRSVIRKKWDVFYLSNKTPTREQVLNYATAIDRKYGGLFIPPL